MTKSLVIVESPAKAKTIGKFLGPEFDVRASVGHIADLPSKGLAIDVENSFTPAYELTERGKDRIRELKTALKGADELYLATDEDREGEAIAAHLIEYLNPRVPVKRMVFHEITKTAIEAALASPRQVNTTLVDAAEARRILDRLFGYELSPILWRKVNRGLSAGRVQSPAIRLVVEREEQRRQHRRAPYWDLEAVTATTPSFTATLVAVDGRRVATGKDFNLDGTVTKDVVVVGADLATSLTAGLAERTLEVRSVETRPYRKSPKAPFMTSTLQQEGGNKLRMSASEVMRVAQSLYEAGYITYMRTDAVVLGAEAMVEVRAHVASTFGAQYLSEQERTYKSKVKNAQEAHEAIRPSLPLRSPEQLTGELHSNELALYRLIWQRTLASQMVDATGTTLTVRLGARSDGHDCEFSASGTTIQFPGYQQAYEEAIDDDANDESGDARLPALSVGDAVALQSIEPKGHETQPPARYTEATLVKKLEEEGIGRPSTYASIIGTIIHRGYVWKKGQALVPSWTSFAVVKLLTTYFPSLVDYKFTANLNNELDEIADGTRNRTAWLAAFYFGDDGREGLKPLVEHHRELIDAALLNTFPLGNHPTTGESVFVRPGRYGPYVRSGEHTASVPESMAPDELTLDVAVALLAAPKMDDPIGEWNGHPVFVKTGRYGPYVQWGTVDEPPTGFDKPRMESLLSSMTVETVTFNDAINLLSLPRVVGVDPVDGEPIVVRNGRYGPYVQKSVESRSLDGEEQLFSLTLEEALAKLAQPRTYGRRGPAKPPLKEFGADPVSGKPVVAKDGKFGTYVTDGVTNASLTRGDRLEFMTPERAFELLAIRREAEPSTKSTVGTRTSANASKTAAKKPTAKKAAAKKGVARAASGTATPVSAPDIPAESKPDAS